MVYITGDCHGEFQKFSTKKFPQQKEMSYQDTMIVLGDFGLWHDTSEERYWLDWLNDKPFTTVFVDGNHENFDRLYSDEFREYDFHGGRAQEIRRHIYHLMRGYVFEFDGKSFWAFGGAQSHDMEFRVNHKSWWEQELPSQEEMNLGLKVLKDHGNEVDFVISHCCPQDVATFMGYYDADRITMYFSDVVSKIRYGSWWFGHYHREEDIFGKFHCRYEKIERIV